MSAATFAKVWQAIRVLPRFTYAELQAITGRSYKALMNDISLLKSAGYVKVAGKSGNANVFTLVKNTGPKAPKRRKCLYDPNTDEVIVQKPKGSPACGSRS